MSVVKNYTEESKATTTDATTFTQSQEIPAQYIRPIAIVQANVTLSTLTAQIHREARTL